MSLWDVDKSGQNRRNPTINSSDFLPPNVRMAHGTTGFTLVDEATGEVAKMVIKDGKIQVYRNDGNLMGQFGVRDSDADGALDVAKLGQSLT